MSAHLLVVRASPDVRWLVVVGLVVVGLVVRRGSAG
jgi:hypothetical protein